MTSNRFYTLVKNNAQIPHKISRNKVDIRNSNMKAEPFRYVITHVHFYQMGVTIIIYANSGSSIVLMLI